MVNPTLAPFAVTIGDGVWDAYFGPVYLGQFDERFPSGRQGDYLSLKV